MANSWGSGDSGAESKYAAREENIIIEMNSQADLGIDVQQIDDGWQGLNYEHWVPVAENNQIDEKEQSIYPTVPEVYTVYPEGWENVKSLSKKLGVKLGLWSACVIEVPELLENQQQGDFLYFKIDFSYLDNMTALYEMTDKARDFIRKTDYKARINWDVTEVAPRMGYFMGREYGNIFLANRKPNVPESTIYRPALTLRDSWQLSDSLNLNKFQISIQNGEDTNREKSDAYLHSQDYITAIALMGAPIFFHLTQKYTDTQRKLVKELLSKYKSIRNHLYNCYIFPVGDKPNNSSWSGFQAVDTENNFNDGYILLFRERLNQENSQNIELKFNGAKEQKYIFTNLITEAEFEQTSTSENRVSFEIENAGSFLFLHYSKN